MPAVQLPVADSPDQTPDYPRVALLSLGHLTNDMYGNLITSITPYLVLSGSISTAAAGLVALVYLLGSSVLQPVFGATSDRTGRRVFAVLGPLWVGIAACVTGWAGNTLTLLVMASIGGIGTAAFHPQAAAMVNRLSYQSRGWVMSIFSMGGNVGFAIGPLVAAAVATIGLHYSPVIIVPGVLVTLLLVRLAPEARPAGVAPSGLPLRSIPRRVWGSLSILVSIIAVRGGLQYALILFLPLYAHAHGSPAQLGSAYAFILSLAGAAGGLAGGRLSDRYGRRPVVVVSLLVSMPLLYAALLATGPVAWLCFAVSGAALLASNSVTVVQGQELLPANTGMASGLTMGLGFGLSGVIGFGLAALAGHIGVDTVIFLVPLLAPVAATLGLFARDVGNRTRTPSALTGTV